METGIGKKERIQIVIHYMDGQIQEFFSKDAPKVRPTEPKIGDTRPSGTATLNILTELETTVIIPMENVRNVEMWQTHD